MDKQVLQSPFQLSASQDLSVWPFIILSNREPNGLGYNIVFVVLVEWHVLLDDWQTLEMFPQL